MTVARFYELHAAEGRGAALESALRDMADQACVIPGCLGVELLRDADDELRFFLIEKWTSIDVHMNAWAAFSKEARAPVIAALDRPHTGAYLNYLTG